MIEFIYAKQLKKEYAVLGNFYKRHFANKKNYACRNLLEIVLISQKEIVGDQPDAIFIMMNPGSSRPLDENIKIKTLKKSQEIEFSIVEAKPDPTQYQLMRIMRFVGWRYVRVLNLSDLSNSKSNEFVKLFQAIENNYETDCHTIFSNQRRKEFNQLFPEDKSIPIICAWGVNKKLKPLIEKCQSSIDNFINILGQKKDKDGLFYYHPKRPTSWVGKQKVNHNKLWLKEIRDSIEQIEN